MSYNYNYRTVSTSPWLALQQIKKTYRDTSNEQLTLLDKLVSDASDSVDDTIDRTVIGASNRAYRFIKTTASNDLTVKILNLKSDGSGYQDEATELLKNYFAGDGMNGVDSLLTCGLTLSSILSDISDGQSFNGLIANITNAFQSAQSLSYADISAICSESGQAAKDDKDILMNYLRQLLSKGKINSYSWMALIRNILSKTNDQVSNDILYLDTSQPYVIRSMVSYIFASLVPLVIAGICLLLTKVFGAIIFIIYTVLKSVIDVFKNAYNNNTTITVNDEAMTDYIDGPVEFSVHGSGSISSANHIYYGLTFEDGFCFNPIGPYHNFSWRTGDSASDSYVTNCFISPGWRWDKALETLANWGYSNDTSYGFVFNPDESYNVVFNDETYYMSPEEVKAMAADAERLAVWIFMSIRVAQLWNQYVPRGHDFVHISSTIGSNAAYALYNTTRVCDVSTNQFLSYVSSWWRHQRDYPGSTAWTDNYTAFEHIMADISGAGYHSTINAVYEGLQYFYTNVVPTFAQEPSYDSASVLHTEQVVVGDDSYDCAWTSYAHFYKYPLLLLDSSSQVMSYPMEAVPPDRYITIPSTTDERVRAAMALVTTIATAVITTALVAKKALATRSIRKKTLRASSLLEDRDIYSRYPDSDLARTNYVKNVKRYNLKAKLFGWQTFDPTNGWFDSPSDASQSVAAATLFGSDGGILSSLADTTTSAVNAATALGLTNLGDATQSNFNLNKSDVSKLYTAVTGNIL